jgi:hypothetical protein
LTKRRDKRQEPSKKSQGKRKGFRVQRALGTEKMGTENMRIKIEGARGRWGEVVIGVCNIVLLFQSFRVERFVFSSRFKV